MYDRLAWNFGSIFMDVSLTLEIAIYVLSYYIATIAFVRHCIGLKLHKYFTYLFEGKCCSRLESFIIISQNFPFRMFFRYCLKSPLFPLDILAIIPLGSRISCTILKGGNNLRRYFHFNTSYLTDSYIIFTLKMESVSKNTIFGLKMMVKSGLEKIILKSLHAGR